MVTAHRGLQIVGSPGEEPLRFIVLMVHFDPAVGVPVWDEHPVALVGPVLEPQGEVPDGRAGRAGLVDCVGQL